MSVPEKASQDTRFITLSPFYHSAINAVTEPNRLVFCSRYLVERWSPLLGGTGIQILLYLRSHCFHDRRTRECRNQWQVSRAEIGRAVGVSEATVKRELLQNRFLRLFIQPQQEYSLSGGRGGVRRDANSYRIAMDDPIHESDWPRVEAYVRKAEALKEKERCSPTDDADRAKRRARHQHQAAGQSDPANDAAHVGETLASGQIDPTHGQDIRRVRLTHLPGQIDPAESGRDLKSTKIQTFNVKGVSNFVATSEPAVPDEPPSPKLRSKRTQALDKMVEGLVAELKDFGSERRHHQLLDICQQRNLDELPRQALAATRQRLASEGAQGPLERPGAYYQSVLLALLEDHQVFVPKLGEGDPDEVRRLARASLGLEKS